ncbi:hypothetical protein Ssi02_77520 [Sinosporangium siamense]|uniref:Uncharacterized protein n=1 Tax=Sinosporangium siamense TaxID=1367973 RepID=A0A919RPH3_9ACTN|nr:hypothetical protein Ssi02_77520 [Sinosporangium siamense]
MDAHLIHRSMRAILASPAASHVPGTGDPQSLVPATAQVPRTGTTVPWGGVRQSPRSPRPAGRRVAVSRGEAS